MLYLERKPVPALRPYVKSLWYAQAPSVQHPRERILPNGCANLVIALSRDFLTDCATADSSEKTAPVLLVGQRSVHEVIATDDLADLAGVLFEPGVLPALLRDRADLVSNLSVPLASVCNRAASLRNCMQQVQSPDARLKVLEQFLLEHFTGKGKHAIRHPAVTFALAALIDPCSRVSVADLARQAGWSERRLSQVFREQVGFAPTVWRRLQRFQHSLRQLRAGVDVRWAELAVDCGFYDQAHLSNEFRAFSGIDLTTYKATAHHLWMNHTIAS